MRALAAVGMCTYGWASAVELLRVRDGPGGRSWLGDAFEDGA